MLIIGAGVIGCLYGYRLIEAGYSVTFLAKGERINQLRAEGLKLYNIKAKKIEKLEKVSVIEHLHPDDC